MGIPAARYSRHDGILAAASAPLGCRCKRTARRMRPASPCGGEGGHAMIRPLRQRHRRIVIVLGIFLPVAFVAGVAARKPVPGMASLPPGLVAPPQKFSAIGWERTDLFTKTPI